MLLFSRGELKSSLPPVLPCNLILNHFFIYDICPALHHNPSRHICHSTGVQTLIWPPCVHTLFSGVGRTCDLLLINRIG